MGKGVDWEGQLITLDKHSLLSRPAADGLRCGRVLFFRYKFWVLGGI